MSSFAKIWPPGEADLPTARLMVAAAYTLTGLLGLEMAIPPGYATAIWPPSGIALAAVLLRGPAIWPGVMLGSFLTNVGTSFDATTPRALALSLVIPAVIGAAAALQAVIAGWLVRRLGKFPNELGETRQVARLLVFGGLIGCLVNPAISVPFLTVMGRIAPANLPFSLATWWAGDAAGVFVFTPLILSWLMSPRAEWRGRWLPITVTLGLTFTLAVLMVMFTASLERGNFRVAFAERARILFGDFEKKIARCLDSVNSIQSFQAFAPDRKPEEFALFSAQLIARTPCTKALIWAPARSGRDGAVAFPVTFIIHPRPADGPGQGFDLATDPARRELLAAARDSGMIAVAGPLLQVKGQDNQAFAAFQPVYDPRRPNATVEDRRRNLLGFAVGTFRFSEMFHAAFAEEDMSLTDFWLVDETDPARPVTLFANTQKPPGRFLFKEPGLFGGTISLETHFAVHPGGRTWVLHTAPTQSFVVRYRLENSWTVLIAGLLFTSLVGAFVMVATGREGLLLRLVAERTAALRESETRFGLMINAIGEYVIYMLDPEGRVASWNAGAERTKGYRAQEIVGQPFSRFFPEEECGRSEPEIALAAARRDGKFEREGWRVRKDGSRFLAHTVVDPVYDATQRLVGFAVISRDITEPRQAEEALAEAKRRAEAANLAKSEFIANMSHEIRTPMNAILGLAHLLVQMPLRREQRDLVEKIVVAGRSLLGILTSILDFSKIEANRLELECVPFDLDELLDSLAVIMTVNAAAKGLALSIALDPEVPRRLKGDAPRLQQVLMNLLGNGIKFTHAGEVALRVGLKELDAGRATLTFEVRDTGIGLSDAERHRLFQPFFQGDASTTRRYGGTGLGLAICQRLVGLMGGSIEVASRPGAGSTFRFAAPFLLADSHDRLAFPRKQPVRGGRKPDGTRLKGVRLLVVEDNPLNRDVARRILENEGAIVEIAGDGQEAVARICRQGERFALVLMDTQMPVMDGYEAARRIRTVLDERELPIIALTAAVQPSDRDRCFAAGMNEFLAKPFEVEQAVDAILRHLAVTPATDAGQKRYDS